MGESIQSFQELRVYQAACALDEAIFLENEKMAARRDVFVD